MMRYSALAPLTLAAICIATAAHAALAWSANVLITKIEIDADPVGSGIGEIYLRFSAAPHTTTCSHGSNLWIVGGNPDTVKAIHAAAIAAKLSGTQVKVLFNPTYTSVTACSNGGSSGYPVLRGLEVQ